MLLIVCVSAFVPFVCVMAVGVGVSGWWVFQCRVAVVCASRRVPGVLVSWVGVVSGVFVLVGVVLVWVGSGVGWLVPGVSGAKACVAGLVCVLWFRMLMRVPLSVFFVLLSWFCLFVLLITLPGRVGLVWCGVRGAFWVCVVIGLLSLLLVKVCVCGRLCVCEGCECSACLLV